MDIPHYPLSTIEGHRGRIVFGKINAVPLLAFQGRIHFYETGGLETVLYPIHVACALGVKNIIVTNAAGGVNPKFSAGDLMMITDHINLTFELPVTQRDSSMSSRSLYDEHLRSNAGAVAKQQGINLQTGIYCGVTGPSYETAAEIQMVKNIGADAVGMSTVNEVSLAVSLGMKVLGISCITNLATGVGTTKLSHQEVTDVAGKVREKFSELIRGVITAM